MRLRAFFLVSFIIFLTVSIKSWGSVDILPPLAEVEKSTEVSCPLSVTADSFAGGLSLDEDESTIQEKISLKYPDVFRGGNTAFISREMVETIRELLETERKKKVYLEQPYLLQVTPFAFLAPYVQSILDYLSPQNFKDKELIIAELENYKIIGRISVKGIFDAILKMQGAISLLTKEEQDIYQHFFHPLSKDLKEHVLNESYRIAKTPQALTADVYCYIGNGFSTSYLYQLERELTSALPLKIWQPVLGESYLGIHYILENLLSDFYLIAVPSWKQSKGAHGIKMSTLGFTVHDLVHLILDARHQSAFLYASNLLTEALEKGAKAEIVIPLIVKLVNSQYRLMMKSLKEILIKLDKKATQERRGLSEQNYHKALTGFFWIMRETKGILEETFEVKTFEGFIRHITAKGIKSLHERTEWECPFDPFETSPIDGTTCLSDEEIKEKVFENLAIFQNFLINQEKDKQLKKEIVKDCFVTKSPRFIDVRFVTITEEEFFYSFPTLLHRYRNAKHNALLFKKTGIELLFEKENTLTRQAALIEIQNVQKALVQAIESFSYMAISFASEEDEEEITLEQVFWFEFDKIIRTYKKGIVFAFGSENLREVHSK